MPAVGRATGSLKPMVWIPWCAGARVSVQHGVASFVHFCSLFRSRCISGGSSKAALAVRRAIWIQVTKKAEELNKRVHVLIVFAVMTPVTEPPSPPPPTGGV
jgi:hypothetical protein